MNLRKNGINLKLISFILIFSILMQIVIPLKVTGATLGEVNMKTTATSLKAGETVELEIYLTGNTFAYFEAYMEYDTTVFETVNQATDIKVNPQLTAWNVGYSTGDTEFFSVSRSSGDVTCDGLLATITLKVLKDTDSTKFKLNDIYINNDIYEDETIDLVEYTLPVASTKYDINYYANTSDTITGLPSTGTKKAGQNYTIAAGPTREGYEFKEWNTVANGTGTAYAAGSTYSVDADLDLYAQWKIKNSTLVVNPNGGTWNGASYSQTFTQGYGTIKTIDAPTATPNGNRIRFNANGGQTDTTILTQTTTFSGWTGATLNGTTYTFGLNNETLTANYVGDSVELPTATKTGSTFKGWYDAATGGNFIGEAGDLYTPVYTTSNASITLFAQYQDDTYTLKINPNGGTYSGNTSVTGTYNSTTTISNPTAPNGYTVKLNDNGNETQVVQNKTFTGWTVTSGNGTLNGTTYTFGTQNGEIKANYTENTIELPTPTKTGYTFDGWYTQATGGTKVTSPYMPTSNITLYAHWTANTYTITFNPGQNGTVNPTTKTVTYDQAYGTLPTPTRPGYEFNGWKNPSNQTVNSTDIVKITGPITLTAEWLGAEYTVTFNYNGGTPTTPATKKVRNEGIYGELPTPTKTGYTFEGWYNSSNTKIESTTTVNLTADETLTAKWKSNTYKITFDPGENATIDEQIKNVNYGDTYGTLPIPTKPGYIFDGWYGPDGNKIEETDVVDILTDITVTAKWTGEKYTLTFDYDGGTGNETSRTIQNGLTYGTLPTANKTGYTFKGWFDKDGKQVQGTEIVNTTSDVTLYAKYDINNYKVTFKNDDGTIISAIDVEYGKNAEYTGNTPEKSNVQPGYEATFNGWQDASKLTNITEDVTVTATYTIVPKVYTITYNNLKNSDNSANPTTYTIEDSNITLVDLPNQGKNIFKGWYTTNDETGTKVTSIDTSKLENIILHAQWENDSLYFKSKKYKVGENDIDNYEPGDIYLNKIEPKTTLSELIDNCDTNGKITVINEKGQTLKNGDLVGTNMTIKVTRDDEEITLTTVVMGDLDGNGKVTATDLSVVNQVVLRMIEIKDATFMAADLDDNKKITATDLSTINNTILKKITLTYKK